MLQLHVPAAPPPLWFDGLTGQEDELEDVSKGKLEAPTADTASDLDEAPVSQTPNAGEDAADQAAEHRDGGPEATPDDELRRMEEKFARTVTIDKPVN